MNDTMIENILRKAPRPKTPAGLTERLKANIAVPRPEPSDVRGNDWRPILRRWTPALSFGAFLLACLVAIAVQSNVLSDLQKENNRLETSIGDIEQLRRENAEYQRLFAENQQLEQLRKDNQELATLRSEVAQLREQVQVLAQLRAENQRLLAQQTSGQAAGAHGDEDPFAAAKQKAQSTRCVNNLKQISLGARFWAQEHNEILPPDFLTMTNELNSPKILTCPSDTTKTSTPYWAEFARANSYEFLAPRVYTRDNPQTIMVRCPIHGHVGLIDGSVQQGGWKNAIQQDGRWLLERRN